MKNKKVIFTISLIGVFMLSFIVVNAALYNTNGNIISNGPVTYKTKQELKNVQKNISFFDEDVILTYKNTMDYKNKVSDIYLDENENEYIFNSDELIGYIKNKKITPDLLTKETNNTKEDKSSLLLKKQEVAEKILNKFVNTKRTNSENYELNSSDYVESYNELSYSYCQKISGIETTDCIHISLETDGSLSSYSASHQGEFSSITDLVIDKEKMAKYISDEMAKNYPNISFDNFFETIMVKDNKYVVACYIALEYENGMKDTTVVYYPLQ